MTRRHAPAQIQKRIKNVCARVLDLSSRVSLAFAVFALALSCGSAEALHDLAHRISQTSCASTPSFDEPSSKDYFSEDQTNVATKQARPLVRSRAEECGFRNLAASLTHAFQTPRTAGLRVYLQTSQAAPAVFSRLPYRGLRPATWHQSRGPPQLAAAASS